jgi:peptidoglycan hydrolase CwlO-like protein
MSDLNELRERVARLEEHVTAVGSVSRSLDDDQETMGRQLAALRHLVQALSITQSEHTEKLERIEQSQVRIIALLTELIRRTPERPE